MSDFDFDDEDVAKEIKKTSKKVKKIKKASKEAKAEKTSKKAAKPEKTSKKDKTTKVAKTSKTEKAPAKAEKTSKKSDAFMPPSFKSKKEGAVYLATEFRKNFKKFLPAWTEKYTAALRVEFSPKTVKVTDKASHFEALFNDAFKDYASKFKVRVNKGVSDAIVATKSAFNLYALDAFVSSLLAEAAPVAKAPKATAKADKTSKKDKAAKAEKPSKEVKVKKKIRKASK